MTPVTVKRVALLLLVPVLVEILAALLISMTESGADAEGFAYIVVLVMLFVAVPVTIVINLGLIVSAKTDSQGLFLKAMTSPAIFIVCVLIYHTGLWDGYIDPLIPRHVNKIQPASSGIVAENTYEAFFIVIDYQDTEQEQKLITDYAKTNFRERYSTMKEPPSYSTMYYFVPREDYDPFDEAVNREKAIAVFRNVIKAGQSSLERVTKERIP